MTARVSLDRRTILNACLAGGIIAAGISAYAWWTLDDGVWLPPNAPSRYMSGGLEVTGARVGRELARRFPEGAPMPQVLDWFERQGFTCDPHESSGGYVCLFRRSLAWNQAAELRVLLRADGQRYLGAEPRVELRQEFPRMR
jgi:hypothetical protein